jgi:ethanolamine kinase
LTPPQLLKLARHGPGMSQEEIDRDSVLMRSYGNNTDILIDRDREATSHSICAQYGLAPSLLARFKNGLLYRYIPGDVCTAQDLTQEQIWRPVARLLGEWHARLPISAISSANPASTGTENGFATVNGTKTQAARIVDRSPSPNIWTVMLRWVHALPQQDAKQRTRKAFLEQELQRSFRDLDNEDGPGRHGFVFGHGVSPPSGRCRRC